MSNRETFRGNGGEEFLQGVEDSLSSSDLQYDFSSAKALFEYLAQNQGEIEPYSDRWYTLRAIARVLHDMREELSDVLINPLFLDEAVLRVFENTQNIKDTEFQTYIETHVGKNEKNLFYTELPIDFQNLKGLSEEQLEFVKHRCVREMDENMRRAFLLQAILYTGFMSSHSNRGKYKVSISGFSKYFGVHQPGINNAVSGDKNIGHQFCMQIIDAIYYYNSHGSLEGFSRKKQNVKHRGNLLQTVDNEEKDNLAFHARKYKSKILFKRVFSQVVPGGIESFNYTNIADLYKKLLGFVGTDHEKLRRVAIYVSDYLGIKGKQGRGKHGFNGEELAKITGTSRANIDLIFRKKSILPKFFLLRLLIALADHNDGKDIFSEDIFKELKTQYAKKRKKASQSHEERGKIQPLNPLSEIEKASLREQNHKQNYMTLRYDKDTVAYLFSQRKGNFPIYMFLRNGIMEHPIGVNGTDGITAEWFNCAFWSAISGGKYDIINALQEFDGIGPGRAHDIYELLENSLSVDLDAETSESSFSKERFYECFAELRLLQRVRYDSIIRVFSHIGVMHGGRFKQNFWDILLLSEAQFRRFCYYLKIGNGSSSSFGDIRFDSFKEVLIQAGHVFPRNSQLDISELYKERFSSPSLSDFFDLMEVRNTNTSEISTVEIVGNTTQQVTDTIIGGQDISGGSINMPLIYPPFIQRFIADDTTRSALMRLTEIGKHNSPYYGTHIDFTQMSRLFSRENFDSETGKLLTDDIPDGLQINETGEFTSRYDQDLDILVAEIQSWQEIRQLRNLGFLHSDCIAEIFFRLAQSRKATIEDLTIEDRMHFGYDELTMQTFLLSGCGITSFSGSSMQKRVRQLVNNVA